MGMNSVFSSKLPNSNFLQALNKGFWLQKFWFLYREKKKELEREELWKKLEELKLKKALEKQNSAYNMHSILSNTSDE